MPSVLATEPRPFQAAMLDAIRFWEPRRIVYNLALAAVAVYCVARTWPHFRPAFEPTTILPILVLAGLANLCYSAAYVIEMLVQASGSWHRRRWILWLLGTLFAMAFTFYWIMDEIYPAVPFRP
ncbi:MAG TPA: hypothetical protein VJY35_03140 [Candidatus Eisenbacteria bacterium]|nr:hypothetical protein [Candidatus Eisenbacteria bacterium]